MAEVYWIHLPEHTDMFSQGYIGFTSKTTKERYAFHLYKCRANKDNIVICNAIRKYGEENIIVDTLCKCSNEYGLWLEGKLRPLAETGWNMAMGGDTCHNTGRVYTRKPHSDETKIKLSNSVFDWWKRNGKTHDFIGPLQYRSSSTWMKQYNDSLPKEPWLRSTSNPEIWLCAENMYSSFKTRGCVPKYLPSGSIWNKKTIKTCLRMAGILQRM